jgi:hypothetical protein
LNVARTIAERGRIGDDLSAASCHRLRYKSIRGLLDIETGKQLLRGMPSGPTEAPLINAIFRPVEEETPEAGLR